MGASRTELFDIVLAEHLGLVRHLAKASERDESLAEELVQDILLAIHQSLPRLKDPARLRSFVARIAHNRAVSHVAREVRRKPPAHKLPDDDAPEPDAPASDRPDAALHREQQARLLQECLDRLSVTLRRIADLALAGLAQIEIAQTLGENPNTVTVALRRARLQLTACVERNA